MQTKYANETSSLYSLLVNIVEVSRQNPAIRELARRLKDNSVRALLEGADASSSDGNKGPASMKERAEEMIASGWPMEGFRHKTPYEVREFVRNVASGFSTEEKMSESQLRFWSIACQKFGTWKHHNRA